MSLSEIETLMSATSSTKEVRVIAEKVIGGVRISQEEGNILFNRAELGFLGSLASLVREKKHGKKAFFIRNFHIEPTNICIYNCKFCSYSFRNSPTAWELSVEEILKKVVDAPEDMIELHITGGVHPKRNLDYYAGLLKKIKDLRPEIHLKAYSAIELDYMFRISNVNIEDGLKILKENGLDSIPGGGAEIFDENIREQICDDKTFSRKWLEIHETAHRLGIGSNATMLYGHIENYNHRIEHLDRLRQLQDRTNGFNSFIPLKFRNKNNELSYLKEVTAIEDMKNYAVSRIYLDNIPHIKAYWPMIGKQMAQLALSFGVDDLDGTINDSTQIYSFAGAGDKNPAMTTSELVMLIKNARRIPVERDSWYNEIGNPSTHTGGQV